MLTTITAIIVMALIGLVLGCVIGIAAKIFFVKTDPRIEQVCEMLPGANCGGCGRAGCSDFAKAIVAGEATPDKCPVNSPEAIEEICNLLGIVATGGEKQIAVVLCGGDVNQTKVKSLYNGVSDCISANLIAGGPKGCGYGCLGMASCARACPFNAIEILNGLAVVHPQLCVGCGKCVETCPRDLIKLVPASAKVHVYCSSPEKGPVKKKVCAVPCLGCRKCFKAAEENIEMNGFRAMVNYDNPPGAEIIEAAQCPTNCILLDQDHYNKCKADSEGAAK